MDNSVKVFGPLARSPLALRISITGDPSTPRDAGAQLADATERRMLTVEDEQHTLLLIGTSPCVNDVPAAPR